MDGSFVCAYCLEPNSIFVEPDGGASQQYIEDCQVCCRPNSLSVWWDNESESYLAESQPAQ